MLCVQIEIDGTLTGDINADPTTCPYVLNTHAEYSALTTVPAFEDLGITAAEVTEVIGIGFALVVFGWALGLAGSWAGEAVRRA